ncbi:DUF1266 domain-containing protein [Escherichia albertii]|nr:DUF1266 domain-containing protein [Escherichia albertii]
MDKDEQYLLFALSAPMEILNQGCKPSHDSPKMYTGIKEFDLSSSWGINNRDDLIQTIYQMTDEGHANDLAGLYLAWHRSSPEEWKTLISDGAGRELIYIQFVEQTAMCCGEAGIKAWGYVRMGFLSRVGVLNNWLTEEESLWLQSRVYVRARHFYNNWAHYFAAYSLGRLYWQSSQCEDDTSLREALTLCKYDSAGSRMFEELVAGRDRFYATLPWRPLTVQPECPATLKDVSDL